MEEAKAWLRAYAIGLYETGDGREADWPLIAQGLFAASFAILDEARGDERARKVLRRVEEAVYDRLARNADGDLPPVLDGGPAPAAKPLPPHRLPEPRHRP